MAETTQFVSRISVKDLISAFETKSETVRVEFTRPRARSYGNVLNRNVVVRLNEFTTLEDIEKSLTKLETDLNFYEVYNKAKHVAFQEQFFNILTSVVNIENDEEDAPIRKKSLISRTQTLVSFLNQKLPSNINQVIDSNSNRQYKYKPYSTYVKPSPTVESNPDPPESKPSNELDAKPTLYVESGGAVDIKKAGEEYYVSVKKLKENFQQNNEIQTNGTTEQEEVSEPAQKVAVTRNRKAEEPKSKKEKEPLKNEREIIKTEEKVEPVSVTKLRNLFEQRTEENSKGLEIITVDKPQLIKNPLGRSVQNINVPYTDWNLGTYRLHRSTSGNYMNYSGLLKRVDINRSNSGLELNKDDDNDDGDISDEVSSSESDDTVEMRKSPVKIEEVIEKNSTSTTDDQETHPIILENAEEVHVNYSSGIVTEDEKNNVIIQENVANGTATFGSEGEPEQNSINSEDVANLHGFGEEEVSYSNASTEDVNQDEYTTTEEEVTYQGTDEVKVTTGIADSKDVQVEESMATLEAAEEDVPQLTTTFENPEADEHNTIIENELSIKEVDEIEVNSGIASSENVEVEEHISKLQATTEDISQSIDTSGRENHVTENEYDVGSSSFNSLDLEDERDRSIIEEVIENIDVEKTLANADLVVNPEDLKNADDEFEKLIETSETKI